MRLSQLHLYPVKSLRGCAVASAEVDALGIVGDRRFLVADASGKFLTQRVLPRMALIATALADGRLLLTTPGLPPLSVPIAPDPGAELATCEVWSSQGLLAEDCGRDAATWLSSFLGQPCRLLRIGARFARPMLDRKVPEVLRNSGPHLVAFNDAYPFLLIGQASLDDLNLRLVTVGAAPVPMNRFRPNLVVEGSPAYAEDGWRALRIGALTLHAGGPCARCVITTTDQDTAERGVEPLRTLAGYRRDPGKPTDVNFGQNLLHESKHGQLQVGDEVIPLA